MQRTIDQPCPAPFYCFIWSWWLKSKFRDRTNYGETFRIVLLCVPACFVVLKSFVSWQALAEALKQNSTLTNLNLARNNIGDPGAKAWCLSRMMSWGEREWKNSKEGSRHRRLKEGNAVQRWFSDVPYILLKALMTTDWGIGEILAGRKMKKHIKSISRERVWQVENELPCLFAVSNRTTKFGMGSQLFFVGCCEAEMVYVSDDSQILREVQVWRVTGVKKSSK